MKSNLPRIISTAAVLAALTLVPLAQQTPAPAGVIRIDVNLVQVDAVVTDNKGRPVTDLKAEDFELLQDGQPQKITNFEFVSLEGNRPKPTALFSVKPRNSNVPPPPPTLSLRPDQIQRTIAVVVDDLGLSFDSVVRLRESLKKWVDTEMQQGDLVAIVRTSSGTGSLQRFSLDKQALHAAIDLIRHHWGRVGTASFAPMEGGMPPNGDGTANVLPDTSSFDDEVQHAYLVGSIASIQYVIRGLRDLPGRKSLILFSESMRFTYLQGSGLGVSTTTQRTGEEFLRKLVDEANRSSVVIHAVDPRGLINTALAADDNGAYRTDEEVRAVAVNRMQQLIESRDGMQELTQRTGGLFARDNNDLSGMLRRVVDDGDGYYLLAYQPEYDTFEDGTGKARFHSIKLRVKRSGLTVRSRSGFFGRPDIPILPEPQARRAQIAKALTSPFATGDIRVHLTGLFHPSTIETESGRIRALLHFDANDLTFTEEADGGRSAEADLVAVTFDAEGQPINTVAETYKIRVNKDTYPEILRTGLVYGMDVPVKKPGGYQLRAVLRDTSSQRLGSAMQFVNVPDVKNGRLTLSGIALAAEFSRTEAPDATPALRIFKKGDVVVYAYEVLNARVDAAKTPQLDSQLRLFRDGQQIHDGSLNEVPVEGQAANSKRVGVTGRVQLLNLPPGSYVLQIVVHDNLRYDKYRIAAQAIDFEVQP